MVGKTTEDVGMDIESLDSCISQAEEQGVKRPFWFFWERPDLPNNESYWVDLTDYETIKH